MCPFVGAVGQARPVAPPLEVKPFDEDVLYGLYSMPGNGTCIVGEGLAVGIRMCVGISEVTHSMEIL